jgi:PST family polysaccharide transporter
MSSAPIQQSGDSVRHELDRKLLSGVAWTAVARWGSQLVSWSALFFLARLLAPADFGLVGMTGLFMGLVTTVSEFGLDGAILVTTDLSAAKIRELNAVSVMMGALASLLALVAASPLAAFFHSHQLKAIVPVMGISFFLSGFRVVPQTLLVKEMRFKLVSAIETAQGVIQACASVLLAYLGLGYWALVLGGIAGVLASLALFFGFRWCGFSRPSRQIARELGFSWKFLVSRLSWYVYSNSDFAVAGRRLGQAALGQYTMAWNIANIPIDRLATLVIRVTPSIFSAVQHDRAEVKRYLRTLIEGISIIAFPVAFGLALVARPLMDSVFDPRWRDAATPLCILAISVAFRALTPLTSQVLNFVNDVDYAMWQSVAGAVILPPAFFFAARWGINGISGVWLCLACPFLICTSFVRAGRKTGMSMADFIRALKPASAASLTMIAVVLAERALAPAVRSPLLLLTVLSVSGAATYLGVLAVFFRPRIKSFIGLVSGRALQRG